MGFVHLMLNSTLSIQHFDYYISNISVVIDNLANLSVDDEKNKQPTEVQRNTSDEK